MRCRGIPAGWLILTAGLWGMGAAAAPAQEPAEPPRAEVRLPLDEVAPAFRDKVRQALEKPTLSARGPVEAFACRPSTYQWLLDHPDRAVVVWKRLGAKCVDITDKGDGRFGWGDEHGSDVTWEEVYRGPHTRAWYAEGRVRPALLLPTVPIRAVMVLHFTEETDASGRVVLRHQAEMALHTDSRAVGLATRLMGASAPKLGEQYMGQFEMFYSALAWYLDRHPDQARPLLAGLVDE